MFVVGMGALGRPCMSQRYLFGRIKVHETIIQWFIVIIEM